MLPMDVNSLSRAAFAAQSRGDDGYLGQLDDSNMLTA